MASGLLRLSGMSRVTAIRRHTGLFLLAGLCLLLVGCESLFLGQDHTKDKLEGMRVNATQLRLTMRAMVNPMTGEIRKTANEIIESTDDPEIQFAALRWKATATPAIREALFSPSGFIALFDTWGLSFQMMDYFEAGRGKEKFGPYAPMAYDAAKAINERIEKLYASITLQNDTAEARKIVRQWATNYPITDEMDARETIINQATEISLALGKSFRDSVDEMVTTVDDLNRKIGVYSAQLPEQARWEAELLILDVLGYYRLDETAERMPQFMDQAEKTMDNANVALIEANGLMQDIPELIDEERNAILAKLTEERKIVMGELNKYWDDAYNELETIRTEALANLQAERVTLQNFISKERQAAIDDVDQMRRELADDIFYKALILLALIAVYLLLLTIGILWYLNHKLWSKREA